MLMNVDILRFDYLWIHSTNIVICISREIGRNIYISAGNAMPFLFIFLPLYICRKLSEIVSMLVLFTIFEDIFFDSYICSAYS